MNTLRRNGVEATSSREEGQCLSFYPFISSFCVFRAASAAVPTNSEQLALDSEMDGSMLAEEKEEEKRQKDETWAQFTDENPKGVGNTMNRG
jgi:hypothetical protein